MPVAVPCFRNFLQTCQSWTSALLRQTRNTTWLLWLRRWLRSINGSRVAQKERLSESSIGDWRMWFSLLLTGFFIKIKCIPSKQVLGLQRHSIWLCSITYIKIASIDVFHKLSIPILHQELIYCIKNVSPVLNSFSFLSLLCAKCIYVNAFFYCSVIILNKCICNVLPLCFFFSSVIIPHSN